MNTFVVICFALLAIVAAQEEHKEHHEQYIDYHAHPHYRYDYMVHDPKTHDYKHQWEERDGDSVKGEYSLKQPDGRTRTVKYTADKHQGFNAEIEFKGHGYHHYQRQHHEGHSY